MSLNNSSAVLGPLSSLSSVLRCCQQFNIDLSKESTFSLSGLQKKLKESEEKRENDKYFELQEKIRSQQNQQINNDNQLQQQAAYAAATDSAAAESSFLTSGDGGLEWRPPLLPSDSSSYFILALYSVMECQRVCDALRHDIHGRECDAQQKNISDLSTLQQWEKELQQMSEWIDFIMQNPSKSPHKTSAQTETSSFATEKSVSSILTMYHSDSSSSASASASSAGAPSFLCIPPTLHRGFVSLIYSFLSHRIHCSSSFSSLARISNASSDFIALQKLENILSKQFELEEKWTESLHKMKITVEKLQAAVCGGTADNLEGNNIVDDTGNMNPFTIEFSPSVATLRKPLASPASTTFTSFLNSHSTHTTPKNI